MDIKSDIYNSWLEAANEIVDRSVERLAAITSEDPAHWTPNIKSATVGDISITFDAMVDAHFTDKRKRPRVRKRLVRSLREQESCQLLLEKMVDLGFLVKK